MTDPSAGPLPLLLRRLPPELRRWCTPETGYLASGLGSILALLLCTLGFWWSAWSPMALERPAALVVAGQLEDAVQAYDRLAAGWGPAATREEAAWRAAQLSALELETPQRGVDRLRSFLGQWPQSEHAVEAEVLLAGLYASELADPVRAAESWERAAEAAPGRPEAGRWLLEAGRTFGSAGASAAAERALRKATRHPEASSAAWLALGRLLLPSDASAAYEAYDQALRSTADASAAALARLGRATALERLEGRDAALAELDEEAAAQDDGLLRRRQRLKGDW